MMFNDLKYIRSLYTNFLDILYPQNITCMICDNPIKKDNTYSLCKTCFDEMNFILDGCGKCGKFNLRHSLENEPQDDCNYCKVKTFYFERSISCIEYGDMSKKIILGLKYRSKTFMCKYIAQIMTEKVLLENLKFDFITFVPLHKKRLRKRGFNQAEKISKYLSKILGIELLDTTIRVKNTRMLYKLKKHERNKEIKNAFKLREDIDLEKIEDKTLLLVDDVFTTGSTVNEISKVLKLSGVKKIYVLTLLTKSMDKYEKIEI